MAKIFNIPAKRLLQVAGFQQRQFAFRDEPVYYLEGGNLAGPKLVIFPGYGDTVFSWSAHLLKLGRKMHVYALDFPGYNGFSRASGAPSFDDLEAVAVAFLETVVGGADYVIGNSMGGWLGLRVAHGRPQLLRHLIPVNPGGVLTDEQDILRIRDSFRIESYFDFIDLMKTLWHRMPLAIYPAAWLGFYQYTRRPEFGRVLDSIQESHFMNDALKQISQPISVIWGTEDRLFGEHMAYVIMSNAPNARYYPIRRAGHMPQLEQPRAFFKALDEIFARTARK